MAFFENFKEQRKVFYIFSVYKTPVVLHKILTERQNKYLHYFRQKYILIDK